MGQWKGRVLTGEVLAEKAEGVMPIEIRGLAFR